MPHTIKIVQKPEGWAQVKFRQDNKCKVFFIIKYYAPLIIKCSNVNIVSSTRHLILGPCQIKTERKFPLINIVCQFIVLECSVFTIMICLQEPVYVHLKK